MTDNQSVTANFVLPPGAFSKNAPENLATSLSNLPTLSWFESADAASYEYCLSATSSVGCTTWINVGNQISAAPVMLLPVTTYYWQVRANNAGGTTYSNGASTAFWSFTTIRGYNLFLPFIRR